MKNPNDEKWKILKEEANQILFQELEFTSHMKEKVRYNCREASTKSIFLSSWKKRMILLASAAAVFTMVFITSRAIEDTEKLGPPNEFNTFMGGTENSQLISEPPVIENWTLVSEKDIKQMFPEEVLIPTYAPELFQLKEMNASGPNQEEADQVVMTYMYEDQSYLVIIEKSAEGLEPQGFEIVDINGVNGFFRTEGDNDYIHTEVEWELGDYHYVVIGFLTPDEALKVAQSFK